MHSVQIQCEKCWQIVWFFTLAIWLAYMQIKLSVTDNESVFPTSTSDDTSVPVMPSATSDEISAPGGIIPSMHIYQWCVASSTNFVFGCQTIRKQEVDQTSTEQLKKVVNIRTRDIMKERESLRNENETLRNALSTMDLMCYLVLLPQVIHANICACQLNGWIWLLMTVSWLAW